MSVGMPELGVRRDPELDISSFCQPFRPCDQLVRCENQDEKLYIVGRRLFFVGNDQDPNLSLNNEFLQAYLDHLDRNRVMLVEGAAGSGKSALVEEISMLYISNGECKNEGEYEGGYAIATNGTQTLTELRLFSYRDGSVNVWGPLAKMQKDANDNPDRRYVFILHEYNRVTDFMSVLGNALESELRSYGPDSWFEGEEEKHQPYSFTSGANGTDRIKLPSNLKIVLTSNPPRDGFAGVVGDFMADGALSHNRLLGAKVKLPDDGERGKCSLERSPALEGAGNQQCATFEDGAGRLRKNTFPCRVIVDNLWERFTSLDDRFQQQVGTWITELINQEVNPGKIVAEVSRFIRDIGAFVVPEQVEEAMPDQLDAEPEGTSPPPTEGNSPPRENLWGTLGRFVDEGNVEGAEQLLQNSQLWDDYSPPTSHTKKTTLINAIENCASDRSEPQRREEEEFVKQAIKFAVKLIEGIHDNFPEQQSVDIISAVANRDRGQPYTAMTRALGYELVDVVDALLRADYNFPLDDRVYSQYVDQCEQGDNRQLFEEAIQEIRDRLAARHRALLSVGQTDEQMTDAHVASAE